MPHSTEPHDVVNGVDSEVATNGIHSTSGSAESDHEGEQEAIAIIGMSLKFAGDATTPEEFWNMLIQGRSAMTDVPKDRFNIDAYYHPDKQRLDTVSQPTLSVELGRDTRLTTVAQLQRRPLSDRKYRRL